MRAEAESSARRGSSASDAKHAQYTTYLLYIVLQKVIDEQVEAIVAQQMNAGGGGKTVLESALKVLTRVCQP